MTLEDQHNINQTEEAKNELEFINLRNAIFKNKKIIFCFTLAGLFLSFLLSLQKSTWKGEFEIVLENPKSKNIASGLGSSLSGVNLELLNGIGINSGSNSLKTEIEILKSPSVLLDIFNLVQNQKNIANQSNKIRFTDWRENLNFSLIKDTSILSISYISKDKESIIPVLNKISDKYQKYSGKKRLKKINSSIEFFDNQIDFYNKKSAKSIREVQKFALKHDFGIAPIFVSDEAYPNVESKRVSALNQMRIITEQLEKIKNDNTDINSIIFSTDLPLSNKVIIDKSKAIETELAFKRKNYQENDKAIKKLEQEKKIINEELKKQTKSILEAKKLDLDLFLNAIKRPDGIEIKYFQLVSEAKKDLETLEKLKVQHRVLSLDQAKSKEPWQLITQPTLLPNPIAPKKLRILAAGIFIGFLAGCGFARLNEGRKNLVLNKNHMIEISKWDYLCELTLKSLESSQETLKCLALGRLSNTKNNISVIKVGNFENEFLEKIVDFLQSYLQKKKIKIFADISEANQFGEIITVALIGQSSVSDVEIIKQKLSLQEAKPIGIIIIK